MRRTPDEIDELVEDVIVDAYGEDEQLGAFVTVIGDHLPLRTGGTVSGHPAVLLDVEAEGWPGHPLVTYRRDGETLRASLLDVQAPPGTELTRLIAAYRRWAGLETAVPKLTTPRRAKKAKKKREWSYPLRTEPAGKRAARLVQHFGRTRSADLKNAGYRQEARDLLRGVLALDQRCIDAHGHIGNIMFDRDPAAALVHYQTGVALGELALPFAYDGVLIPARKTLRAIRRPATITASPSVRDRLIYRHASLS